jgi:hypothetical protein
MQPLARRAARDAEKAAKLAAELPVEPVKQPDPIIAGDYVRIWGEKAHGRVLQITPPMFIVRVDGYLNEVRFFRDEIEKETK